MVAHQPGPHGLEGIEDSEDTVIGVVRAPAAAPSFPEEDTILRGSAAAPFRLVEPAAAVSAGTTVLAGTTVSAGATVLAGTTVLAGATAPAQFADRQPTIAAPAGLPPLATPPLATPSLAPPLSVPAQRYYAIRIGTHELLLDVPTVVGRRPRTPRIVGDRPPRLVRVPSVSQEISSTHLEVRQEGQVVVVTDLDSTNGTIVTAPGGAPLTLRQGESVVVVTGTVVDIGDDVRIEILPIPSPTPEVEL